MKKIVYKVVIVGTLSKGAAQELSLRDLYNRTNQISELSNQGSSLQVLDKADEALRDYADYEGAGSSQVYSLPSSWLSWLKNN